MRLILLWLFVPSLAMADVEDSDPYPVTKRATWIGIVGHAGKLAGLDEAGVGPGVEVSLGKRRWQYFVDAALSYAVVGPSVHRMDGMVGRVGIGARWLARSYTINGNGGIEMNLEAFSGVDHYRWRDGDRDTRFDLGFGVGWQLRFFETGTTFRTTARAYFTPEGERAEVAMPAARTTTSRAAITSGLAVLMGFSW